MNKCTSTDCGKTTGLLCDLCDLPFCSSCLSDRSSDPPYKKVCLFCRDMLELRTSNGGQRERASIKALKEYIKIFGLVKEAKGFAERSEFESLIQLTPVTNDMMTVYRMNRGAQLALSPSSPVSQAAGGFSSSSNTQSRPSQPSASTSSSSSTTYATNGPGNNTSTHRTNTFTTSSSSTSEKRKPSVSAGEQPAKANIFTEFVENAKEAGERISKTFTEGFFKGFTSSSTSSPSTPAPPASVPPASNTSSSSAQQAPGPSTNGESKSNQPKTNVSPTTDAGRPSSRSASPSNVNFDIDPPTITTLAASDFDLSTLSTKALKRILLRERVSTLDITDREELLKRVKTLVKNVYKEMDTSNDSNLCVVCAERTINCVLLECGHQCSCIECAETLSRTTHECPMCRSRISRIIHTFKS